MREYRPRTTAARGREEGDDELSKKCGAFQPACRALRRAGAPSSQRSGASQAMLFSLLMLIIIKAHTKKSATAEPLISGASSIC